MAVKRVIVLTQSSNETEINYSGLFWIPVTSGIRTQTSGSSWVANGTSLGAVAAENTGIGPNQFYGSWWDGTSWSSS